MRVRAKISGSDGANIGMRVRHRQVLKSDCLWSETVTDGFEVVALSGESSPVPVLACNVHQRAPHEPSRKCLDQCGRSLHDDFPATQRSVVIKKTCPYAIKHGNVCMHHQV